MSRDFININYHIEFETPFHFGTGLRRNLLDRSVCRDADDYLYIPGSTLKGVFRERCEQIARLVGLRAVSPHDEQEAIAGFRDDIDIVDRIFGSRYKQSELYFDNVTMVEADQKLFDSDRTSSGTSTARQRYEHKQVSLDFSAQCVNKPCSKANLAPGRSALKDEFTAILKDSALTKTNGVIPYYCLLQESLPMTDSGQINRRGWENIPAKFKKRK